MRIISNETIARAIYMGAKDKQGHELPLYLKNVVKFLAQNRFISKAPGILHQMKLMIDNENSVISAKIFSATNLATQTKHHLTHLLMKRYGAKEVEINDVIDTNLLGGMRIEIADEVIDLSIKNKIGKLQEYLNSSV